MRQSVSSLSSERIALMEQPFCSDIISVEIMQPYMSYQWDTKGTQDKHVKHAHTEKLSLVSKFQADSQLITS